MMLAICIGLVLMGILFFAGAVIGVLRFPDFYTRVHAAGKGDTLSSVLILVGLSGIVLLDAHYISYKEILVAVKLLLIGGFIFVGSPTASHALMDAGYESELPHWKKK